MKTTLSTVSVCAVCPFPETHCQDVQMRCKNMKQNRCLYPIAIVLVLCLCCIAPALAETNGGHTVVTQEYDTYVGRTKENILTQQIPLCFLDGVNDLPYIELGEWAKMMDFINRKYFNDENYGLTIHYDYEIVTLTRENGYSMNLDFKNDRLIFTDYNAFVHTSDDTTLIDIVSENGIDDEGGALLMQRNTDASFERYGHELVADLAAYNIHLVLQDDKYYVPLQTMNDFTLLRRGAAFLFNQKALFLANDELFFDYSENQYTEIAKLYYEGPTGERSPALAEYSYNELCLALDTFYGLKDTHEIDSFRDLFYQIGLEHVLAGTSAADADYALKSFIDTNLNDLHSMFNEFSYLTGLENMPRRGGTAFLSYAAQADAYKAARAAAYPDGWFSYEEVGNTAYVTFDNFTSLYNGNAFYKAKEEGNRLQDTIGDIIYAHAQITREDSPIENVVLDLSNNQGGSVDAAVFVLGWMLGDAPFSLKDMSTGASSTAFYRSDVNLDHVYDEKDTISDKNLYCLISPVSFSCGNLIPAVLKNSHQVTLLGKTSAGGSCVVQPISTAYGAVFQISSSLRMSFPKNGAFYNIDQGVEPDIYIDKIASFYNRPALTDFINGLF